MTYAYKLTAGIDATVTESVKANLIIAKADLGVSISLRESGEQTVSTTNSVQWTSGPAVSYARRYAVFAGGTRVTGTYTYQTCGRTFKWGPISYGTFGSWGADSEGSALCGYHYPAGSIERVAQVAVGSCVG